MPYAPALIQLADSHFSFVTAPSGDDFEIRLKGLEASVGEIASALKTLTQAQVGAGAFASAPDSQGQGRFYPRHSLAKLARDSGIVVGDLSEIQALISKHRGGLGDFTSKHQPAAASIAEPEDFDSEGEPAALLPVTDPEATPMETAVLSLTKIVAELAKQRKKAEKASSLEALDRAEGFAAPGEASSSSARRAVQSCCVPPPQRDLDKGPGPDLWGRGKAP